MRKTISTLFLALFSIVAFAQFDMSPTCDGAIATINGDDGGVFQFNPTPTDGAVIDSVSGTVTNAISGETYTVEYTINSAVETITFTVLVTPIANTPEDIEVCDNNDFASFNLQQQDVQILDGLNPNDFFVTHYATQADAMAQTNALNSPYVNTTNPQAIYAVIESNAGCPSNVVTYNLIVNSLNANTETYELVSCDNGNTGIATFNLTQFENQITIGNQDLMVSYFEDINDANANTNEITNPVYFENYNSPGGQQIFIRIEDPITGCTYVNQNFSIFLNVDQVIITNPEPLYVQDDDNDGFATFDLDSKIPEIIGTNNGIDISFYETFNDASAYVNPLSSPYSNIVANTQTIYFRAEDVNSFTDCFIIGTLELITQYNAFQLNEATIEMCQTNPDFVEEFNLTTAEADMLDNLNPSEYSFAYYENQADAANQTNAITNPTSYTNNQNLTEIYVGVTQLSTGEYVTTNLYLIVNALPSINFSSAYSFCDGESETLFVGNQNNDSILVEWSLDGVIIQGETNSTLSVDSAGNYSVMVVDVNTGCIAEASTVVTVLNAVNIIEPEDLVSCDNDGNGSAIFDLTSQNTIILNGLDPNTHTISFYLSEQDALSLQNAIVNETNYEAFNTQDIYVRVDNSSGICPGITTFNLILESCPVTINCGSPITNSICYTDNETQQYTYISNDASPLQIVINAGAVENNFDELIVLDSDGVTNLNANAPYGNNGDVTGLVFVSSGEVITLYVSSDSSLNCQSGTAGSVIDYTVSCVDTTVIPNCDAALITPQDLAVDVSENTDLEWEMATGYVTGYFLTVALADGSYLLDMVDVGNVTTYNVGLLDYATQYFVTITTYNPNGNGIDCSSTSFTTRNDPNVIVDCALQQPVNTTFCYENNETQQYNFSSNDGSPLYIVFNSGSTESSYDALIVLDSDGVTNLNADNPYGNDGDLSGLSFTTSGDSVTVYIESDFSVIGCENDIIDFDVFCGNNIGMIEVNAFLDENNNGVFDANDTAFTNGFFTTEVNNDGNISIVNSNTGTFTITNQDETNSYDITFEVNPDYENCFNIPTALFENVTVTNGNTVIVDFPITEQMACEDLAVYLVPFSSPRPGFNYWNDLVIENLGATTIASGTVTFINDPIVNYVDATIVSPELTVTPTATGATIDFTNLLPGETRTVWFSLYTPPTVALGEFVTSSATYTTAANDIVSSNNTAVITQEVIGSYDPNDITESHGKEIVYNDFVTTDEYLYYTIRFQNVGTAEAINVRIENTVDALLDISTLELLKATHDVVMLQNGNQLTWTFENINLPAQSQDNLASNGYVHFKIKPTAGYAVGTIIPNTAEIYFDFNAPVITNIFQTEFVEESLSVSEFNTNSFSLYPNPATRVVNIKLNNALRGNASVEIINVQGKVILRNSITETLQLNVENLQSGLYFVKLKQNNNTTIKKLIIE